MTVFFDRCIAPRLARIIEAYDPNTTIRHQDLDNRFTDRTDDETIIRTVARDDPTPIFITSDISQRRQENERAALRDSGMTVVFFARRMNSLSFREQAIKIIRIWDALMLECRTCKVPTAFEVRVGSDKIGRIGPTAGL